MTRHKPVIDRFLGYGFQKDEQSMGIHDTDVKRWLQFSLSSLQSYRVRAYLDRIEFLYQVFWFKSRQVTWTGPLHGYAEGCQHIPGSQIPFRDWMLVLRIRKNLEIKTIPLGLCVG
jgi:hypothetical protein